MEKETVKRSNESLLELLRKILKLDIDVFKENKGNSSIRFITTLIQAISYGFIPFVTKYFFDEITVSFNLKGLSPNFLKGLIFFVLAQSFGIIWNGVSNSYYPVYGAGVIKTLSRKLFKKSKELSLYSYEDPKVLDEVNNAVEGLNATQMFLIIFENTFIFYLPATLSFGYLFLAINPLLLLIIPMIVIPALITQKLRAKAFTDLADKLANVKRQRDEYQMSFLDQKYFKETRFLGLVPIYLKRFSDKADEVTGLEIKTEKTLYKKESILRLISILSYTLIISFLIWLLITGRINVSAFSVVITSLGELYSILEEIIYRHAMELSNSIGYVKNFINFLDKTENLSQVEKKLSIKDGLRVENLSFSYPSSDKKVLNNVSFKINAGEKIAVVGENGSGKSTLSKIILGLYPHYEGKVLYGEDELKDYSIKSATDVSTAVYQDFNQYRMTLRDNVVLGDIKKELNEDKIRKDLSEFNLNPSNFNNELDTMLSTEFGGQDLSKGQWQSVSMVRAQYKDHELIVLDEPTSAIDPEKESKIYHTLSNLMKGKTSIIVTHRLGLTKIADRIIVLDKGNLIEEGTHEELMSKDTHYKKMYMSQLKWYQVS